MFISFESGEGSGKTTQAKRLACTFQANGYQTLLTREPGGSDLAEELRNIVVKGDPNRMDAETELLIFTAARRDHINKTIAPALAEGKVVICDRYLGSTHALQGAAGIAAETIDTLDRMFCNLRPDLTIFLDMDSENGLSRSLSRSTGTSLELRFEAKGRDFHRKVGNIFQEQCNHNAEWRRVDAKGSINEVGDRIITTINDFADLNLK